MAKTIKFNLICDNKPIRTIEDLQNNFSIEDILEYYNNGLLLRWLKVRGYEEKALEVEQISAEDSITLIKELIKIFDIEKEDKKIEEDIYMFRFIEEKKILHEEYQKNHFKVQSVIEDYQTGFEQLVRDIIDNPDDAVKIKANINELVTEYKWAMDLNHRELFWKLREVSNLAVMCMLMNEETRKYYLPVDGENEDADMKNMFRSITKILAGEEEISKMGDNIKRFKGYTDGYWKDLETKDKKYMILKMGQGDFVRSAGNQGGDLSSTDIENKFVIVEGIDYKSNSNIRELIYMEV